METRSGSETKAFLKVCAVYVLFLGPLFLAAMLPSRELTLLVLTVDCVIGGLWIAFNTDWAEEFRWGQRTSRWLLPLAGIGLCVYVIGAVWTASIGSFLLLAYTASSMSRNRSATRAGGSANRFPEEPGAIRADVLDDVDGE